MKPKTVLVETNWVVDIIAPAHFQNPQALQLLQRAQAGEFKLYVPAICLAEARETVPQRFTPQSRSNDLRKFIQWAKDQGRVTIEDADVAYRVFDQFDGLVANELMKVSERLDELAKHPSLNVFPLSEPMLERQISIGAMELALKTFDLAVVAAMIVKSEELRQEGNTWVGFCEMDSDLQPWDKSGARKRVLGDLYDDVQIFVYPDFLLEDIDDLPDGWTT